MPFDLLQSVSTDLVNHLEVQVARARALSAAIVAYRTTRDRRELAEIVRQLQRIRLLNTATDDFLVAANLALDVIDHREIDLCSPQDE